MSLKWSVPPQVRNFLGFVYDGDTSMKKTAVPSTNCYGLIRLKYEL